MGSKQNDTKRFISSTETKLCKKGCGYFVSQQSGMDLCTICYTKIVNNHIALAKAFALKTNNNTDHSISEIEKDIDLLYAMHTRKISSSSSIKQEEEEEVGEEVGEEEEENVEKGEEQEEEEEQEEQEEEEEEEEIEEVEENSSDSDSDDAEEIEAIKPSQMFFPPSEYQKQIKLGTRCFIVDAIKTLKTLEPSLSNMERKWFEEHSQFRHIFHMKPEKNHKVQGMWMLLMRTVKTNKRREVWFIVNGVPIRYGLREHALLSGLNCCNYPLDYKKAGGTKFVDRHFKNGESIRLEDVKEKLVNMGPHKDRLKMAVLFFLSSVVCAQTKVGKGARNVLEFFQRAVDDLHFCKIFPWGRYSYEYMLKEISHTMDHFGGVVKEHALWPQPGFCVPLEILAFEAIPKLANVFREPVEGADANCPRMCKSAFKTNGMKGMSLLDIKKELGAETDIDSIIHIINAEEDQLLDDILEIDDDVDEFDLAIDSWEKRNKKGLIIFFKDMYDEDVAAREKEQEQTAAVAVEVEGGEKNVDVLKKMKKMMKVIKRVEKTTHELGNKVDELGNKVDALSERLTPLEVFVNEASGSRKLKKRKK